MATKFKAVSAVTLFKVNGEWVPTTIYSIERFEDDQGFIETLGRPDAPGVDPFGVQTPDCFWMTLSEAEAAAERAEAGDREGMRFWTTDLRDFDGA